MHRWSLTVVLLLAGCHAVLPLGSTSSGPDDAGAPEVRETEGGKPAPDAAALADAGDGPPLPLPDVARPPPDQGSPDVVVPPPDQGGADASGVVCGNGMAPSTVYGPKMLLCPHYSGVTYCNAAPVCPAGWDICDTVQFLARGGATVPAASGTTGWITGCIKDGSSVFAPVPTPCAATCVSANDPSPPSCIWNCDTQAGGGVTSYYVGVASASTCHRIGSKQPTSAAYWIGVPWDMKATGVVCCLP